MQMLQRASALAVCAGVAYSVYRMTTSEKKGGKTTEIPAEKPDVHPAEAPLSPVKPAPLVVPTGPMVESYASPTSARPSDPAEPATPFSIVSTPKVRVLQQYYAFLLCPP
jgi:hypothetical protein